AHPAREVVDGVDTDERALDIGNRLEIADRHLHGMLVRRRKRREPSRIAAGPGKTPDAPDAMGEEPLHDGGAQKSGRSGNEDRHATSERSSCSWANTASVMAATFSMSR